MVNTIQNDYVMQANEFSERNGIEIKITFKERNSNPMWGENYLRNCYSVYIRNTNSGAVMRVTFWDSIYNTTHNITPTCYDILACLTKYDPGDYEDFCSELGCCGIMKAPEEKISSKMKKAEISIRSR